MIKMHFKVKIVRKIMSRISLLSIASLHIESLVLVQCAF